MTFSDDHRSNSTSLAHGAPARAGAWRRSVAGIGQARLAARSAIENWENEGGPPAAPPRAVIVPTDVSLVAAPEAESGKLAAIRAEFRADFADGRMGRHHNTYQHRSRVLRQALEAEHLRNAAIPLR